MTSSTPLEPPPLRRSLVAIMAIAGGIAVGNLYYAQPLLADIAHTFHLDVRAVGYVPMLTQLGYALGLLLFVPLGDLLERRALIVGTTLAVAASLVGVAIAPSIAWMSAASLVTGATTVVPQLLLPLAAHLAAPRERGKIIGSVMSGLLIGILLARTVSGFVGAAIGWRAMYAAASAAMVALAVALRVTLPRVPAEQTLSYPRLLASLATLVREEPVLREASLVGGLAFGAFSAFWTTLVFRLETPPYHYGSRAAGLFGLVGVVGALAAPLVGRLSDRKSPRLTAGIGQATALAAFVVFFFFDDTIAGLVAGVTLLDLGTQANQVSNQARIYSLSPEARNRLNTVYMVSYFVGGAIGTLLATQAWGRFGWNGVCFVGAAMLALALARHARGEKTRPPRPQPGG